MEGTVREAIDRLGAELKRSAMMGDGWPVEADGELNDASRAVVEAYCAWFGGKCDLAQLNDRNRAAVWRHHTGGRLYNFGADYVLPPQAPFSVHHGAIRRMIRERLEAPYTGTVEDGRRVNAIHAAIMELGGQPLFWS